MQEKNSSPAKPLFALAIFCVCMLGVVAFVLLLRFTLRTAVIIDSNDYIVGTPDNFSFKCDVIPSSGAIVFEGFAYQNGERFHEINTFVSLYDTQKDIYLKLPTTMQINDSINQLSTGGINYSFGGFYSFIRAKQLDPPYSRYEICLAYRSNYENALMHTGQLLAEDIL